MSPTHNDLPEELRMAMVALLTGRVIDARDLYLAAKVAHWNVRGPTFAQLHKLFDKVASAALEISDALAEMALSLGGAVDAQGERGSVPMMPVIAGENCKAYVEAMADSVAVVLAGLRQDAGTAMEQDDLVTSDLFIKTAGQLQHLLFLVERNGR